jgi:predicted GIY-YIG superfamily endonuclease
VAHGKTISIFLVDDDPSSRWICELSNWTGIGFRIPRAMLADSKDVDYLDTPGVYFLIGRTDDDSGYAVYIGETEDVHYRLMQHYNNGDKEWQEWNECVAFCSKDATLNKAKIKYLENRLYNLARSSGRCKVMNGNEPKQSKLSMKDKAETEEYLDNLIVTFGAMGYRFLQKYSPIKPIKKIESNSSNIDTTANIDSETVIFNCTWPKIGCDAHGIIVPEGILVLKNSRIRHDTTPSFKNKGYNILREKLINDGVIVNDIFVTDYLFSSYSAAASVICGNSTNGRQAWINDDHQSIEEYLSN